MIQTARFAYVILAWAFLAGVVVQVFFIGLTLFAGPEHVELHVALGWLLQLAPLLVLAAAALSRAGARHWQWALALTAVIFTVPLLPSMRWDTPVVAALHPVAAITGFWLATVVARNSLSALRRGAVADSGGPSGAASAQ